MTHIHPGPYLHYCDHPDCTAWGSYGFDAPYGHAKPKRPLWACEAHREWAEARWKAKFRGRE